VTYEWVDHPAELELRIEAPSEELVLHAAMQALAEQLGPAAGSSQTHELEVNAADQAALLAEWLEELVFLADTEGFVPRDAEIVLCNTSLRAVVRGETGEPRPLVKAVTYHGLAFERRADGVWQARVVLDV
jgi:SHS2 domain-containing protein